MLQPTYISHKVAPLIRRVAIVLAKVMAELGIIMPSISYSHEPSSIFSFFGGATKTLGVSH